MLPLLDQSQVCHEGFIGDSDSKEPALNAGDLGSIPGSGRSSREGNGNPLQYSCLGNPRGAWQTTVPEVAEESDMTEWLNNSSSLKHKSKHESLP